MNLKHFAEQIFDALQEFDRAVQPFGLYSVRDIPSRPKPQSIIKPFEEQVKLREDLTEIGQFCDQLADVGRWGSSNTPSFSLTVPEFGSVSIQMMRVAKIKVRDYGSRYHLDKNQNYERRWDRLELDNELLQLRHPNAEKDWRMVLFLGFDKAVRPFERELSELKPHQKLESYGIEFFERSWDDSNGRGFKIKTALWAHRVI